MIRFEGRGNKLSESLRPLSFWIAFRLVAQSQAVVNARGGEEVERYAAALPRIRLTARNAADLELIANGSFSPLDRYMGREDYLRVIEEMRLSNGSVVGRDSTVTLDLEFGAQFY